jgi:glycosyltransferase involved in cell wall biosynthesis
MNSTHRYARPLKTCIVVPCHDEEAVIGHTVAVLLAELDAMAGTGAVTSDSYVCCVDDGSRDHTWEQILRLASEHGRVKGIKLSANFGHPNALVAGLFANHNVADVLITMDADLQDDVSVLARMLEQHHMGKRVVYGVRLERKVDVLPKRIAADLYYKLMRRMNGRTIRGHADFRSADARVIADLEKFDEVNLYLRGLFPLIGYPSAEIHYERRERHAGSSKYSYSRLLSLAWQGITSFTTTPLAHGVLRRHHHVPGRHGHRGLGHLGRTAGQPHRRLGQPDLDPLHLLRHQHDQLGRDRRIHRQDLQGGEAPPTIHH